MQVGCKLGLSRIEMVTYADDMVLLTNTINETNLIYTRLLKLAEKLDLINNVHKSKYIVFCGSKYVSEGIKKGLY